MKTIAISSDSGDTVDGDCSDGHFIVGPVKLKAGEQTLTVKASGETDTYAAVKVRGGSAGKLIQLAAMPKPLTNKLRQSVSGTCAKENLQLKYDGATSGNFDNKCATAGTFKASFSLSGVGPQTVTIVAQDKVGTSENLVLTYNVDVTPPSVAITSPVAASNGIHTTEGLNITVSGTCSSDAVVMTAVPWTLSDADCSDGTFAMTGTNVAVALYPVVVTATDDAGNSATATLKIAKAITIGQPAADTHEEFAAGGLRRPMQIWTDGTKFAVVDASNQRVLLWNAVPSSAMTPPDVVLGQPNKSSVNFPGLPNASTLRNPYGVVFAGGKLYVSDAFASRILGWNSWPSSDGQAADFVLGQPDFTSTTSNNGGISKSSLFNPYGLASDGTRLAVADINNNRVLIWNSLPSSNNAPADVVVGQPNAQASTSANGGATRGLSSPTGVAFIGTSLMVADWGHNRVAVFNSVPTVDYELVSFVLGQASLTAASANVNGVRNVTMYGPRDIATDGTRLFVSDNMNNRVLVWNTIPTVTATAADIVLGQSNFTSRLPLSDTATTAATMILPYSVAAASGNLWVSDHINHRILRFSIAGLATGASADLVLGRAVGNRGSRYLGIREQGLTPGSYVDPQDIAITPTGKVIFAESGSHRVLIFDKFPSDEAYLPSVVLGQPSLAGVTANNSPTGVNCQTMNLPTGVHFDGVRLYVVDYNNNRVLIWNTLPTSNYQVADRVLGQPNCTAVTANNPSLINPGARMNNPRMVVAHRIDASTTKVIVSDVNNHRVLVWDNLPAAADTAPNSILGQSNATTLTANAGGITASSMNSPRGVATDGTRIAVADLSNNRVLLWNAWPASGSFGTPADVILGQTSATGITATVFGLGASSMSGPHGVSFFDDSGTQRLAVADSFNNRVLIWDGWPSTPFFQPANRVLGQSDFSRNVANFGGSPLLQGLIYPGWVKFSSAGLYVIHNGANDDSIFLWRVLADTGEPALSRSKGGRVDLDLTKGEQVSSRNAACETVSVVGGKVFCLDTRQHRLLIWNSIPRQSYQPADVVVGQPDFTSYQANNGGLSASSLNFPIDFWTNGTKLVIADNGNRRLLIWNQIPTTNFAPANVLLGQSSFTVNSIYNSALNRCNYLGASPDIKASVTSDGTRLVFVHHGRALLWNSFPTTNNAPADIVLGQSDFDEFTPNPMGRTTSSLSGARSPIIVGDSLIISDVNRLLKWNTWPDSNNQPADVIVEPTSHLATSRYFGSGVRNIAALGPTLLAVADYSNNRLLLYDGLLSNRPADRLWGKPNWSDTLIGPPSITNAATGRISGDANYVAIARDFFFSTVIMPSAAVIEGAIP